MAHLILQSQFNYGDVGHAAVALDRNDS